MQLDSFPFAESICSCRCRCRQSATPHPRGSSSAKQLRTIFVQSTLQSGYAILDAAGLSFLGVGIRPPAPEWGAMISQGAQYLDSGQWWSSLFPGLAIAATVMSFNLIGDSLQDLLDPQRR